MLSPFEREISDPFAPEFVDLETLNAHASDAIKRRVDEVRERAPRGEAELRSCSLTILGPAGAGKTHLFARLRKACGARASFVLQRPEVGVEMTLQHVLAAIVEGLKRPPPNTEETLLDVIVGTFLAAVHGANVRYPRAFLADLRARGPEACEAAVSKGLDHAESRHPDVDAEWLEQLLQIPFASSPVRRAAIVWLSGREPSETELRRLGRTERLASSAVLPALRTLGIVASYGAPIVLVFDQLENLATDDHALVHAHARVLADLHDGVRGLVLVQMALESEWERRIRPVLTQAERARLESEVHVIGLPRPEERDELLRRWVAAIPEGERPKPFPAPFTAAQWAELREGPATTPRALIVAARRAIAGEDPLPRAARPAIEITLVEEEETHDADERIAELWDAQLARAREEHDQLAKEGRGFEVERVIGALVAASGLAEGLHVEVAPARQQHDLRVVRGDRARLVFLAQAVHPRTLASTVQHAVRLASEHDVVVVRQHSLAVPPTWSKVREHLAQLREAPRAQLLELTRDEAAELVASHDLLAAARSQDLTAADGTPFPEATVREWLRAHVDPAKSRVLAGAAEPAASAIEAPPARPTTTPSVPPSGAVGPALAALRRLRLASIDRVVREAAAAGATRASVLAELRDHPRIKRLGRSIVWLFDEEERS